MNKINDSMHYRGVLRFPGLRLQTFLDRGSKRFLSLAGIGKRYLMLAAVFTYKSEYNSQVEFSSNVETHRFRQIYISTAFPIIRLSPNSPGIYKVLHFFVGRVLLTSENHLRIVHPETNEASLDVCEVGVIDQKDTIASVQEVQRRVALICESSSELDNKEHAILDHSLRCVERQESDSGALQSLRAARILLCAKFLVNHKTSFEELNIWVKATGGQNAKADKAALYAAIARLTYPLALGGHGYNPSFANLNLAKVAAELHHLMADLETLGVKPFLNSGTLLGYFRDGRPILHDDDFDLGIWLEGTSEAEIFDNWSRFVRKLSQKYSVIRKGNLIAIRMSNKVPVDLFAAWATDGKVFVYPYCYGDRSIDALLPLGKLEIEGQQFSVPADPEAMLTVNYGPNWRVPDPFWRFDYRKSKRRFGRLMKLLKAV